MLFSWLRNRRRQQVLATPFPAEWLHYLHKNVLLYARLSAAEQAVLCDELSIFIAEKEWEGCRGLALTDEIKVTIAAQACLLLLGIDHDSFDRVSTILVYPSGFRSPEGWTGPDGVVHEDTGTLGEAWYQGPVILAWDNVLSGGQNDHDGRNVVLHEFAHQLDYLDGFADGAPPLRDRAAYEKWQAVMTAEYAALVKASAHGTPKVLDAYGATNPAEFFAVATEAFFEKPVPLQERHPRLYEVLREYYGQDTARRFGAAVEGKQSWVQRKQHFRGSRRAEGTQIFDQELLDWPAWVRIWGFDPGDTRSYAQSYLDGHFMLMAIFLIAAAVVYAISRSLEATLLSLALFALLCVTSVWLYYVIRWIDRHGRWAGQQPKAKDGPKGA